MQQIQPLFVNSLELYTLSYTDIPDSDKNNPMIPQSPLFTGSGKTVEGITKKKTKKLNGIKSHKNKKKAKKIAKKIVKEYINDYEEPVYVESEYEEPMPNESNDDDNEENGEPQHVGQMSNESNDDDNEENGEPQHVEPMLDGSNDDNEENDEAIISVDNDTKTIICQLIINEHTPIFYYDNTGNSYILDIILNNNISIDMIFVLYDYNLYLAYLISLLISIYYNKTDYETSKNNILTYMNVNKLKIDKTELNFAEKNIEYFQNLIDTHTIIENDGEYTLENLNSLTVDQLNKSVLNQPYIIFIQNKINKILNPNIVTNRNTILMILTLIYITISSQMVCYTFETFNTIYNVYDNIMK